MRAAKTIAELNAKKRDGTFKPEQDQAALDAAIGQSELWSEGGLGRALLHGATQGALAWIGGGYSLDAGLRGAAGAAITSGLGPRVANQVQQLLNEAGIGERSQTPGPLASLITELAFTGFASSLGNMSALTAASVDINNRQLHALEIGRLKALAKQYAAQFYRLKPGEEPTQEQIDLTEGRLMAQVLRQVDKTFRDQNAQWDQEAELVLDHEAKSFTDNTGTERLMFFQGGKDYLDPAIYADTKVSYKNDYDLASGMRAVVVKTKAGQEFISIPARTQEQQDEYRWSLFWDAAADGIPKGVGNLPVDLAQGVFIGPYGPQLERPFQYDSEASAQFGTLPMTALQTAPWVLGGMRIMGGEGVPVAADIPPLLEYERPQSVFGGDLVPGPDGVYVVRSSIEPAPGMLLLTDQRPSRQDC